MYRVPGIPWNSLEFLSLEFRKALTQEGWRVLRIWESSLRDEEAVIARLQILL